MMPAPDQSGPFSPSAVATLEILPALSAAACDFTVSIHANLEGVTGSSSDPFALGGIVIPVAFASSGVTLEAATGSPTSDFPSPLAYTDARKANARGNVHIANARPGSAPSTGKLHLATLTFVAAQGGTVIRGR